MSDRGRYDSAMFWLAFGTAAAVIGLALMTIGVSRTARGDSLLSSGWFDGGLGLLALGAVLLLWALWLFLVHRRAAAKAQGAGASPSGSETAAVNPEVEVIRGYYKERDKLFEMWDRHEKPRDGKE
jgi:hypothetical protein